MRIFLGLTTVIGSENRGTGRFAADEGLRDLARDFVLGGWGPDTEESCLAVSVTMGNTFDDDCEVVNNVNFGCPGNAGSDGDDNDAANDEDDDETVGDANAIVEVGTHFAPLYGAVGKYCLVTKGTLTTCDDDDNDDDIEVVTGFI